MTVFGRMLRFSSVFVASSLDERTKKEDFFFGKSNIRVLHLFTSTQSDLIQYLIFTR